MAGSSSSSGDKNETMLAIGVIVAVLVAGGAAARASAWGQEKLDTLGREVTAVSHQVGGYAWDAYAWANAGDEGPRPEWAGGDPEPATAP